MPFIEDPENGQWTGPDIALITLDSYKSKRPQDQHIAVRSKISDTFVMPMAAKNSTTIEKIQMSGLTRLQTLNLQKSKNAFRNK